MEDTDTIKLTGMEPDDHVNVASLLMNNMLTHHGSLIGLQIQAQALQTTGERGDTIASLARQAALYEETVQQTADGLKHYVYKMSEDPKNVEMSVENAAYIRFSLESLMGKFGEEEMRVGKTDIQTASQLGTARNSIAKTLKRFDDKKVVEMAKEIGKKHKEAQKEAEKKKSRIIT